MKCSAFCPLRESEVRVADMTVYYEVRCNKSKLLVERRALSNAKTGQCVLPANELRAELMARKEELEGKLFDVEFVLSALDRDTVDRADGEADDRGKAA